MYSQVDVTVLRQACQIFGQEFMEITNIEVSLKSFTIASPCNEVLRKQFLKPDTIGLIPMVDLVVIIITARKP